MVRWGMIGAGDVTEIKSGPAFNKVKDSQLVAIMRRNAAKAEDYARRHKISDWYTSAVDIFQRRDINAIYIATPPSSHKEYALSAIESGKDVYLEKPMAMNAAECFEIVNAARKANVKLCVAHYRRALKCFKTVKDLISQDQIGKVQYAKIEIFQPEKSEIIAQTEDSWRIKPEISGGGLFHDIAPHQIDLMLDYFGEPADFFGFSRGKTPGLADIVNGQIEFKSGVLFQGVWNFKAPVEETKDLCTVIGSRGKIEFSFYQEEVQLKTAEKNETYSFTNPENIQLPLIEKVVAYFNRERENPCSGEDGLKVIEIMDKFTGY